MQCCGQKCLCVCGVCVCGAYVCVHMVRSVFACGVWRVCVCVCVCEAWVLLPGGRESTLSDIIYLS